MISRSELKLPREEPLEPTRVQYFVLCENMIERQAAEHDVFSRDHKPFFHPDDGLEGGDDVFLGLNDALGSARGSRRVKNATNPSD